MPALYRGMAVVQSADEAALEDLLKSGLQRYVVRRLGPAAVQVDHERLSEVRRLFERLGQTPRISSE